MRKVKIDAKAIFIIKYHILEDELFKCYRSINKKHNCQEYLNTLEQE